MCFVTQSQAVAIGDGLYYICKEDKSLEVWDIIAEKLIAKLYSHAVIERYSVENGSDLVYITKNGEGKYAILDIDEYESLKQGLC